MTVHVKKARRARLTGKHSTTVESTLLRISGGARGRMEGSRLKGEYRRVGGKDQVRNHTENWQHMHLCYTVMQCMQSHNTIHIIIHLCITLYSYSLCACFTHGLCLTSSLVRMCTPKYHQISCCYCAGLPEPRSCGAIQWCHAHTWQPCEWCGGSEESAGTLGVCTLAHMKTHLRVHMHTL